MLVEEVAGGALSLLRLVMPLRGFGIRVLIVEGRSNGALLFVNAQLVFKSATLLRLPVRSISLVIGALLLYVVRILRRPLLTVTLAALPLMMMIGLGRLLARRQRVWRQGQRIGAELSKVLETRELIPINLEVFD